MATTTAPSPAVHHHGDSSSHYPLHNHAAEGERLHAQHEGVLALMEQKPIHAPILDPATHATDSGHPIKKIIDIGCGVNADMTKLLAEKFPAAKVYGVDLSEVAAEGVPSNVEFIRGNVANLIGVDERLAAGSADYVFSRFLVAGIEDWEAHIKTVAKLLAPGGWLEMHDVYVLHWYDLDTGEALSKNWEWLKFFEKREPATEKNDLYGIKEWKEWFRSAGLENVGVKPYRLRFEPTPIPDEPAAELYAQHGTTRSWTCFAPPLERWFPGPEDAEKRRTLVEACKENLKGEKRKHVPMVAVWGQKPEQ